MDEMAYYWNIFYTPIHRLGDKVNVVVTTFYCESEDKVRELFAKSYVGVELVTVSPHASRELAFKQIYDMGDVVHAHDDFHEPKMMCRKCGHNTISALSDDDMCNLCHFEMISKTSRDV